MLAYEKIPFQAVYRARKAVQPWILNTPLRPVTGLSTASDASLYFKLENFQYTGSFKLRGAAFKMLNLSPAARQRGVVAVSTGNHGRAVAYMGQQLGIPVTVCLSQAVPVNKVAAIEALGAQLLRIGQSQDEAMEAGLKLQRDKGLSLIPPFDDPEIIAGQGTLALEILEVLPELAHLIVPVSGGGLISGLALALKSVNPSIRVSGVSMEHGAVMYASQQAGQPVALPEEETLADSLRGGIGLQNQYTFELVASAVDELIRVSEAEIWQALQQALFVEQLVLEGAAAVGIAAVLAAKIQPRGPTALILSGANLAPEILVRLSAGHEYGKS